MCKEFGSAPNLLLPDENGSLHYSIGTSAFPNFCNLWFISEHLSRWIYITSSFNLKHFVRFDLFEILNWILFHFNISLLKIYFIKTINCILNLMTWANIVRIRRNGKINIYKKRKYIMYIYHVKVVLLPEKKPISE